MGGKYSRFKKIRIVKKEEREFKNRRRKKKGGTGDPGGLPSLGLHRVGHN